MTQGLAASGTCVVAAEGAGRGEGERTLTRTPVLDMVAICSWKLCVALNSTTLTGAYVPSRSRRASSFSTRRLARLRRNVIVYTVTRVRSL